MNVIISHDHMDLDSLGSAVLARAIFPSFTAVKSRLVHPLAMNLYNVFKDRLVFTPFHALKDKSIEKVIVVDTRSYNRVKYFFSSLVESPQEVTVYDHHNLEPLDIPGATLVSNHYGSNTTYLALLAKESDVKIDEITATVALVGIYGDTGKFVHDNTTQEDLEAAAWLVSRGAKIALISRFLKPPVQNELESIALEALRHVTKERIAGHFVAFFYIELPEQTPGLSDITERVLEIEHAEAVFGCIGLKKNNQILVVGRSAEKRINVRLILETMGGGGHDMAASATLKGRLGSEIISDLASLLAERLEPALTAGDIMDTGLEYLLETQSIGEAHEFLSKHRRSGTPVISGQGKLVGIITLRNLNLAVKNNDPGAPIRGYMEVKYFSCRRDTTMNVIENVFFNKAIGRAPVIDEENNLLGVITRERYLSFLENTDTPD